jgi:hypothetical protein
MNIIRNILAIVVGFLIGAFRQYGRTCGGTRPHSASAGFDGSSMEGVASTIHLLRPVDSSGCFSPTRWGRLSAC